MKKEIVHTSKKQPVKKEGEKSSFDWLLFMFLAFVMMLIVLIIAK